MYVGSYVGQLSCRCGTCASKFDTDIRQDEACSEHSSRVVEHRQQEEGIWFPRRLPIRSEQGNERKYSSVSNTCSNSSNVSSRGARAMTPSSQPRPKQRKRSRKQPLPAAGPQYMVATATAERENLPRPSEPNVFETYILDVLQVAQTTNPRSLVYRVHKNINVNQCSWIRDVHQARTRKQSGTHPDSNQHAKETRWRIQLVTSSGPVDWFIVENSSMEGDGLGVKAATSFEAGQCVGIFVGVQCIEEDELIDNGMYAVKTRKWNFIDSRRPMDDYDNPGFYMGMHMVQKAVSTAQPSQGISSTPEPNVCVYDDLLVYATKDIPVGEELIFKNKIPPQKATFN